MSFEVSYGPHIFGSPILYMRSNKNVLKDHNELIKSLASVFHGSNSNLSNLLNSTKLNISFMNYGDTELIYLLTKSDGEKLILSVNQPHTPASLIKN